MIYEYINIFKGMLTRIFYKISKIYCNKNNFLMNYYKLVKIKIEGKITQKKK
jgi:hypothetical protein